MYQYIDPYFNSYRSHLEKIVVPYNLRPYFLPVPRVSHVFAEAGILYKLVVTKNQYAASDEVVSFRINDQSYSLIGLNQYVIKKMVDSYSYVCVLKHCHTCGLCIVRIRIRIRIILFWIYKYGTISVTIIYINKHDSRLNPGNRYKDICRGTSVTVRLPGQ